MLLKTETKQWIMDEVRSFCATLLTFFAVDAATYLTDVYQGHWDRMLFYQLLLCLLRSVVKTILTLVFPKLFPPRQS